MVGVLTHAPLDREAAAHLAMLVERAGGLRLRGFGPIVGELALPDTEHPPAGRHQRWLILGDDARTVAASFVTWEGQSGRMMADVLVDPVHRGRGLGRMLLHETISVARGLGAEVLRFKAAVDEPGARLLMGVATRSGTGYRLQLDLDGSGSPPEHGTDIATWCGSSPAALATGLATLAQETVATRRSREAHWLRVGYRWFGATVIDPRTGCPISTSELVLSPRVPGTGFVHRTVTHAQQRRRGLATRVKAAALARALDEGARLGRLLTFNETTNVAILNINARLGFRPISEVGFWDLRIDIGRRHAWSDRKEVSR